MENLTEKATDKLEKAFGEMSIYINNYKGIDPQRSEARLYPVYKAVGDILRLIGKQNVVAQGVDGFVKKDITLKYEGGTYAKRFTAGTQVSADLTFREPWDHKNVIRGLEIRNGVRELKKNVLNNFKSLVGEAVVFNNIVVRESKIAGNYFSYLIFIPFGIDGYKETIDVMLSGYEFGLRGAVVPYEITNTTTKVLIDVVPEQLQLTKVFVNGFNGE